MLYFNYKHILVKISSSQNGKALQRKDQISVKQVLSIIISALHV